MNDDETERRTDERFSVLEAARPPDNWPRIAAGAGIERRDRRVSLAVVAALAACLVALVAGLVSIVALRSNGDEPASADNPFATSPPSTTTTTPITTTVPPQVGLSTCLDSGRCAPAEWDAIAIGERVIDLVYYVDAECTGSLVGTRSAESDERVEISVFVEVDTATECSGDVLQRSTSVLLDGSVDDLSDPVPARTLAGCRDPNSVIGSPTDATPSGDEMPDCRVEFVDQFPAYPSERLLTEYRATMEEVGFEGAASEPIDIDVPGTYGLKAYVDESWDLNACAWGFSSEIDNFVSVMNIEPVGDLPSGQSFVAMTDGDGTYVTWTMTVADVTYPVEGFFVTIDQCG